MNVQGRSRIEYHSRINRVMDFIDRNLEQPIELKDIVAVTNSPLFHFYRIFIFLIGETPTDYIQRLRVEKAAWKLQKDPFLSAIEIAYSCGFDSTSLSRRTFKKYFGITPTQLSRTDKPVYVFKGNLFSKNGQVIRKNMTHSAVVNFDLYGIKLKQLYFMESIAEVKEIPEMKAIHCRHVGPFHLIGQAYTKLGRWATPRGSYMPNITKTATIIHDDPSITDEDKIRQSVCIIVDKEAKVEGEIGKMTIPGGQYAAGHFELGMDEFQKAWNTMCHWPTESGYQQGDGCAYELYYNDCATRLQKKHTVDICMPVKPLQIKRKV